MADLISPGGDAILAGIQIPTQEEMNKHLDNLKYLGEGLNGENEFDMEKAAYGYIDHYMRVVVPLSLKSRMPTTLVDQIDLNIIEVYTIMYWNYIRLKKGDVEEKAAFFVAAYRARLIKLGYLYQNKEERSVGKDEVDYVVQARDFYKEAMENSKQFKAAMENNPLPSKMLTAYIKFGEHTSFKHFLIWAMGPERAQIIKFLVFSASQYAAATYLVFRQHGHHYQPELRMKYEILWRATTITTGKDWGIPDAEFIHRIAVHSFGVKILHDKFFLLKDKNKLAETFVDRADVAPCGAALVSTCYAAINLLKSLPIWGAIYASYKTQIDELAQEAAKLSNARNAIQYHKNAKLFGVMRRRLNTDVAAALAPIAKGFISSLGEEADLSKQKTLDKRASQNPVVVDTINRIITKVMKKAVSEGDISTMAIREAETSKGVKAIEEAPKEDRFENLGDLEPGYEGEFDELKGKGKEKEKEPEKDEESQSESSKSGKGRKKK
jgi:hypothetical protein